jgi:PAS domain S-box-containing protein
MLKTTALSAETLASVLAQSLDCVKLIDLDARVLWMNPNGLCAMEIDDFAAIRNQPWADLWPEDSHPVIAAACATALGGESARFDAFCLTAKGSPRWWNVTVSPVEDVEGRRVGLLAVSRDVTEAETGRQALEVAAAEMRHRLRNTYMMIASLLNGFAKGDPVREAFARDMAERLNALSVAQTLFADNDAPCELDKLIPVLISPFETPDCPIAITTDPGVIVSQGQADAIALVLGELAVNATKHGALKAGGSLCVEAHQIGRTLNLVWREQSAQAVAARSRDGGQGLRLIERIVRARHGQLTTDWRSHGVVVTLAFRLTPSSAA